VQIKRSSRHWNQLALARRKLHSLHKPNIDLIAAAEVLAAVGSSLHVTPAMPIRARPQKCCAT
jgi:hypothetical protein